MASSRGVTPASDLDAREEDEEEVKRMQAMSVHSAAIAIQTSLWCALLVVSLQI